MIKLDSEYSQSEILVFLTEDFLEDFKQDIRDVSIRSNSSIVSAKYLGESQDLELSVFEFEHKGSTEKRVTLTKDAFNIMKVSGVFKALAIFKSSDSSDWRFSLMTSTPIIEENKIVTVLSNPKRFSFFLGPNAKISTPTKFLIQKGGVASFDDLKERFSIEVVNKEFYKDISKAFIQLVGGTQGKGRVKVTYKPLLKLPGIKDTSQEAQEFAVRLIGRVIFCWFLREKRDGAEESLMPHELLSHKASLELSDYYHSILEEIFFKVLNVPIESRKDGKTREYPYRHIPYLNGGLFSPHEDDYYSTRPTKQEMYNREVVIPDKWFQTLFEILEIYNFTIDENTGFDEELSIDPEMLGRIFENLLAEINPETGESARKSTGSFYTPREIVDYMVDESLYLHIRNRTGIEEEKIKSLISYDLSDDLSSPLSDNEKVMIIGALDNMKILDPACGSGAFPIGVLQKIVFMLQQLDSNGVLWFQAQIKDIPIELRRNLERENKEKNFDYIRKLGVIRKNIFGVDIQPIATEISRLRCFLTLIVDQKVDDLKDNRGIDPLPNLDFKFVTSNALIPLQQKDSANKTMGMFEDSDNIEELKEIRDLFFNASNFERVQLREEFGSIQKEMIRYYAKVQNGVGEMTKSLVDWDPFSHNSTPWFDPVWMFGVEGGFDIIIGNPPYLNIEKLSADIKRMLFREYASCRGRSDIYVAFLDRSISMLAEKGNLVFIIPYAFTNQKYGTSLREMIINSQFLCTITDTSEYLVFTSAHVRNVIVQIMNSNKLGLTDIKFADSGESFLRRSFREHKVDQADFLLLKDSRWETRPVLDKIPIKNKMYSNAISLEEICFIAYGARLNHRSRKEGKKNYISIEKRDGYNCSFIEGKGIERYNAIQGGWLKYKAMEHYNPMFPELFENNKLMTINVVKDRLRFAYDDTGLYNSHTVINCVHWNLLKEVEHVSVKNKITESRIKNGQKYNYKYLLGVLNSSLINWYFVNFLSEKLHFYPSDVKSLPIKYVNEDVQGRMEELVERMLTLNLGKDHGDSNELRMKNEIDDQIDQLVFEIYDLSDREIAIVKDGDIVQ